MKAPRRIRTQEVDKDKEGAEDASAKEKKRKEGEAEEEPAPWTAKEVDREKIFFNTEYVGDTPMAGRSGGTTEEEAIKWSKVGLIG